MLDSGVLGVRLLALTLIGAAFLVAHLALLVSTWSAARSGERWFALIPVALPIVAFRSGKKGGVFTWGALLFLYILLRMLG